MRDLSEHDRLAVALAAIDEANTADPNTLAGQPLALVEGRTAHGWTLRLDPTAAEAVQLAARAHHLRRWVVPRSTYPAGRSGYLRWRRDQQRRHADELSALLVESGYDDATAVRAATIVTKRGLGSDPHVQLFEDAVALTFLETQLAGVRDKLADDAKLVDVLAKTLAKMSARGRAAATGIELDPVLAELVAVAAER